MNGQTINLIFTGAFLFLTLLGLIKGLERGIKRQIIRFGTIVLSIIISLFQTVSISVDLAELCAGKNLGEVAVALGLDIGVGSDIMNILSCFDAVTAERIVELPVLALLLPLLFTINFILISFILLLVHGILCAMCNIESEKSGNVSRVFGMLLGTLQGVIVAVIFCLPLMNIAGIVSDANAQILEKNADNTEPQRICAIYDEYFDEVYRNPLFNATYSGVAERLCDGFATIEIGEEYVNLRDTASKVLVTANDVFMLEGFDWVNPTDEQCGDLEDIVNGIADDTYFATVLSGGLRGFATAVSSGAIHLGLEEPMGGVVNGFMGVFTTLDANNFKNDIDTILDIYLLLAKEGVLAALTDGGADSITTALATKDDADKTVISKVIETIRANEHMSSMVTVLTKLSVSIMMDNVGIENGEEIYDSIKQGINDVISIDKSAYGTEEEYREAITESLDSTLKDHEITLAPEIVESMAGYVADNFSDLENVTDDEVNDTIFSYYESYMNYVNGGGENPFPDLLPDADDSSDIPEDNIPEDVIP